MTLVSFLASALFLSLALHPFLTYPLTLRLLKLIKRPSYEDQILESEPSFAICMSAFNEEAVIEKKIANLLDLKSRHRACEVLVYVDAATDKTSELLSRFTDQITVVIGLERHGKSHGLCELVKRTSAEILVFTDANVEIHRDALSKIGKRFSDKSVGCVCGNLIYTNSSETATASVGGLYWRIEEKIKQLESDTIGIVGADGSLFAIRRALHEPVAADIIDDFYISMRILLSGHRVVREPLALAFERSGSDEREEFRRKIRISCQAFNVHRVIWDQVKQSPIILYAYISHRLLKWLIIYNLAVSATFFFISAYTALTLEYFFVFVSVVAAVSIYIAFGKAGPPTQIRSILSSLLGVGIGVWRSIWGERFQTWQPISTARSQA